MPKRTDTMTPARYADLVRRVVAWVEERQASGEATKYWNIAQKYNLRLDEVDDICGDSTAYGPQLMPLARVGSEAKGYTRVEVLR